MMKFDLTQTAVHPVKVKHPQETLVDWVDGFGLGEDDEITLIALRQTNNAVTRIGADGNLGTYNDPVLKIETFDVGNECINSSSYSCDVSKPLSYEDRLIEVDKLQRTCTRLIGEAVNTITDIGKGDTKLDVQHKAKIDTIQFEPTSLLSCDTDTSPVPDYGINTLSLTATVMNAIIDMARDSNPVVVTVGGYDSNDNCVVEQWKLTQDQLDHRTEVHECAPSMVRTTTQLQQLMAGLEIKE